MATAHDYALQLSSARRAYQQSQDFNAYMADCTYVALRLAAEELAATDRRLAHLGTALSLGRYGIKGLVDMVVDRLACPLVNRHSHNDFLTEFASHARRYLDRDTEVVETILNKLGL